MPIPGYDLDDLDDNLRERIRGRELEAFLNEDEKARLSNGESLLDLLDEDDLDRLLAGESRR